VNARQRPRVLVTGASGFLGRHVVAALADRSAVVAMVNAQPLSDELASRCDRVVHADVRDRDAIASAVDGTEFVCHLAAYVPADHTDPAVAERCVQTNALATLDLARAALAARTRRFVYASAGTVYAASDRPATENDPAVPVTRATYYLASKLLGELYLEHLRLTEDLPAVSLRISSIYGPGMPANSVVARFAANAARGRPLEVHHGGVPAADLVEVSDVARCISDALESGPPGVFNVGAGFSWSLLEVARSVVDVFGSSSEVVVKGATGAVPANFPALNIEKARRTWSYAPASLTGGLQRLRDAMPVSS
jgi:UDP-glucose 4-epimerase